MHDDTRYTLSKYLSFFLIGPDHIVVAHPFYREISILDRDLAKIFIHLKDSPMSFHDLKGKMDLSEDTLERILLFLCSKQYIVPQTTDEDRRIKERLITLYGMQPELDRPIRHFSPDYRAPAPITFENFRQRLPYDEIKQLRVVVLGGCFAQFAPDALQEEGLPYGFYADVLVGWPGQLNLIETHDPHLVVLQLSTTWLLAPLWDNAAFISDEERGNRLEFIKKSIELNIQQTAAKTTERLLLVQGFSTPQISPLGRTEFRYENHFSRIVHQLNDHIHFLIREKLNILFIDEERIVSNLGKIHLMDDSVAPFSHYAPIDFCCGPLIPGPSREETFGVQKRYHVVRLLASEYLNSYILWAGIGRIKCVIVDLDHILWPGIVGETGSFLNNSEAYQGLKFGLHGGIHQALKLLKERGILLATCSRNEQEYVFQEWQALEDFAEKNGLDYMLRREDFVLHKINWDRKSKNVGEIMDTLGISEDAVLFIDDSPVERAEVKLSFPQVRSLGESLNLIRYALLNDPCLENIAGTRESKKRTDLTRAQLAREQSRSATPDEATFLSSLNIRLVVSRLRTEKELPRVVELIQRTNQFNTTLIRYEADKIRFLIENGDVFILEASDRFANYGIVGVCIIVGSEINTFILSCRVIGLKPAIPFLISALKYGKDRPITARILKGPRNQPCWNIYSDAGFEDQGDGVFYLPAFSRLAPANTAIYKIEVRDEKS